MLHKSTNSAAHAARRMSRDAMSGSINLRLAFVVVLAILAVGAIFSISMNVPAPAVAPAVLEPAPAIAPPTVSVESPLSTPTAALPTPDAASVATQPNEDEGVPLGRPAYDFDGDNAPADVDDEIIDAAAGQAIAPDVTTTQEQFTQALREIASDLTTESESTVDLVWAYALDHGEHDRALAALAPRLQSQIPSVVEHAQRAIEGLRAATNPAAETSDENESDERYLVLLTQAALIAADPQQRFEAIAELGSHAHATSIAALKRAASEPDARNREQAVRSLGGLAQNAEFRADIVAFLEQIRSGGDPDLAAIATEIIAGLAP